MQIHVHTISFSTLLSQVWFGPNDILHGTQSSFASESLVHFPIKLYVPKAGAWKSWTRTRTRTPDMDTDMNFFTHRLLLCTCAFKPHGDNNYSRQDIIYSYNYLLESGLKMSK